MADGFERRLPAQESPDVKALIEGPTGATVKADHTVPATEPDEPGHADRARAGHAKRAKKEPGDPDKLRAEVAELMARHQTGGLKPADKGRLLDLQAELAEAEKAP